MIEFEDEDEAILAIAGALSRGIRVGTTCPETALNLKQRGFLIVGNLHDAPRELSEEELEYIIARRNGSVQ